jgi:hypothetical protein
VASDLGRTRYHHHIVVADSNGKILYNGLLNGESANNTPTAGMVTLYTIPSRRQTALSCQCPHSSKTSAENECSSAEQAVFPTEFAWVR